MNKFPKFVLVEWIDARAAGRNWVFKGEDVPPLSLTYSVGFVYYEDKQKIVLAQHYSPADSVTDDMYCAFEAIPKSGIQKVTTVKRKRKK